MTAALFHLILADGMRRGQRPASPELLYHAVAGALTGRSRSAIEREYLHALRHAALLVEPATGQPFTACPNCDATLTPKSEGQPHA